MFVDSLVKKRQGSSLISDYPKEFIFLLLLSIPFWLIFEGYNLFTHSWSYINYQWYIHIIDFSIIMPAFAETFMLLWGSTRRVISRAREMHKAWYYSIAAFGAVVSVIPLVFPYAAFSLMWVGLFLLIDPINHLNGRISLIHEFLHGRWRNIIAIAVGSLIVGFLFEFWNYYAYPHWIYNIPIFGSYKLFAMPALGYLGYIFFGMEVFSFYIFFRSFIFHYEPPVFGNKSG
ncbi:MAG: hypothetical protein QXV17_10895 [Candidatus Micrarchaeaceae archaeon]